MKNNRLILLLFLLISIISQAQTTTFGDSKPEEFEFLPYEGSRIIQGFRVDMGNEKFCIVYSKPAKGITPDTIFIQEYKKDGLITGLGSNFFKLAGSVILYGIISAFIF